MRNWRNSAACLEVDPELFFPVDERSVQAKNDIEAAKGICRICPVREACLREALTRNLQHGIWGGLDEDERKSLRRRIQRGRAA